MTRCSAENYCYSYYIIINDGDEEEDTYLNAQNMIQRCIVTYMNNEKKLSTHENRTILPKEAFEYTKSDSPDMYYPIRKIKIVQTTPETPEFVIEYYNIKIR